MIIEILLIGIILIILGVNKKRQYEIEVSNFNVLEIGYSEEKKEEYIKWVDFNVSYDALIMAYQWDVDTYEEEVHIHWIEVLAYLGAKYGGTFEVSKETLKKDMNNIISDIRDNGGIKELVEEMKYYSYYYEAYEAVLGGMVGEYEIEVMTDKGKVLESKYGLKAFSPIASGFAYTHYDDFGVGRSYGYERQHLGHDMMGQIGTPIIAIETGIVEALGWNQYGGWRIGIRSLDGKRYYYYAHLRQNYPYAEGIMEGDLITAGDVIGYMGHTGYSVEENVNNIEVVHLHWGLELIFHEEQKESNNEIWIDCYALTQFLYQNRSVVEKVEGTVEWKRSIDLQ